MYPITDDLCHHMLTIINSTNHSRCAVSKCRHRVIEMYCMVCSRVKCFLRCIIISIRMSQRNVNFPFHFLDKFQIIFIIFRSNSNKFHQSVGSFQKLLCNFYITRNNISLILCSFFYFTDKRTFHVNSHKICCFWACPVFLIFCCNT